MSDLADRIEALTGPCREMDLEIFLYLNPRFLELPRDDRPSSFGWTHPLDGRVYFDTEYTASIDAAMSLVPEGFKDSWTLIGGNGWQAEVGYELADAATPALALAAAAIRAKGDEL